MNILTVVTYGVTVVTLIGTVANAFDKRWSFLVWMVTNLFWILYNIKIGQYAQAIIYTANIITATIGFFYWGKSKKKEEK